LEASRVREVENCILRAVSGVEKGEGEEG